MVGSSIPLTCDSTLYDPVSALCRPKYVCGLSGCYYCYDNDDCVVVLIVAVAATVAVAVEKMVY